MIVINRTCFDDFEAAATAFEAIREELGHGATLKYADLPVPPAYWEYAGALEHAMVLYDHDHPEYPCGAVPTYEGHGVFVHETCTCNTKFVLRPCGHEWLVVVERAKDAEPIGGGWNEDIAKALGIDWDRRYWERAQSEWEAEQPTMPKQPTGDAAGYGTHVEITPVERPAKGGGQ